MQNRAMRNLLVFAIDLWNSCPPLAIYLKWPTNGYFGEKKQNDICTQVYADLTEIFSNKLENPGEYPHKPYIARN